jgi:hypothetical protein
VSAASAKTNRKCTDFTVLRAAKLLHFSAGVYNPYADLNYLFERLPNLDSRGEDALDPLLSWNVKL